MGERQALACLRRLMPPPPPGEVWAGDDAAVVQLPASSGLLLLASDCLVVGLDADLRLTTLADLGWKAMAVNLSDIAAMGGRPLHAVVSVVGLNVQQLEELYSGLLSAASHYSCPVVGGDLSSGREGVVNVAVTGWVDGPPVLRSGARPGDAIWVTGLLGAAAAGLRLLRAQRQEAPAELVLAHARPRAALAEGQVARRSGASAMIDVSDGLAADLKKLAESSGVGFDLDEERLPVAPGATLDEALGGGDDYVLVFTARPDKDMHAAFRATGLAPPYRVGSCTPELSQRTLGGRAFVAPGWEHPL